ncbi:aspartic proteinase nepenthesin-2-like [Pistacia vera]|uniref:aspartic proteinase nepenthesin-2-like n=1 Tax=Pistacia vera TaxID=55513 RepID=UPI001262E213|nr:aspartic proteinase nepenthesin-2-like [Pistacia vera]
MGTFQAATLFLYFITTFSQLHFTTSKSPGLTLELIPRDSPKSPLYPGNLTRLERLQRMIRSSDARAAYLEAVLAPNATLAPDETIILTVGTGSLFYIVYVGIGTPPVFVFLLLDTGGGLIWSQCKPCKNCYRQIYPMYDSLASSTYRKLSCDHPLCVGDNNLYRCVDQQCVYDVSYGNGEVNTKGVASLESFTVGDGDRVNVVRNLIFGCSDDSRHPNFQTNGVISGIMGFNRSPDSLASQLADPIGKRFSYCFPSFAEDMNHPIYVKFGDEIPQIPGITPTINFVTPTRNFYYYLKLNDISVGGRKLGLEPGLFDIRQDGSGGVIIDSGALITIIDQYTVGRNAYTAVMEAFQNYYDAFNLERTGQVSEGFDLCYQKPPEGFNAFAFLVFRFEGDPFAVDPNNVHYFNVDEGYFCVALKAGNGISILGIWSQQQKRIIYDENINALQFIYDPCSNDTP